MVYEDRLTIDTPEGVPLELTLAGLGSRFAAALIDYLIEGVIIVALLLVLGYGVGLSPGANGIADAAWALGFFAIFWGYNIAFEVLNSGRTPGKALNGIRVVLESGAPEPFATSAVRNVIRIIDILPGTYLVGVISILVTRRNQRVGDLTAGTLVIRDRQAVPDEVRIPYFVEAPAWDTSAVDAQDLDAVVAFLARREQIESGARNQIASELAHRLRPKVGGAVTGERDEIFLERIVLSKRGRG